MSADNAVARLKKLQDLAAQFSGEPQFALTVQWQNEHGEAGVSSADDGVTVFFNAHTQPVESFDEAAAILRGIFIGEIVLATGYENDVPVYRAFAPASDPGHGFSGLDRSRSTIDVPQIDDMTIETWTSGLQERA